MAHLVRHCSRETHKTVYTNLPTGSLNRSSCTQGSRGDFNEATIIAIIRVVAEHIIWGENVARQEGGWVDGRKSTTRSGGLMARIEHPADVFSGAWGSRAFLNLLDEEGIFPKDVNTNEA